MSPKSLRRLHRFLGFATGTLALATIVAVGAARMQEGGLLGLIVRQERKPVPWKIYDQTEVTKGVSVPPDTNVVFHLPDGMERTTLDVLFGHRSKTTRFWGYCLPPNYNADLQEDRSNLPGQMFLSYAERMVREDAATHTAAPRFSLFRLPNVEDARQGNAPRGRIRHEVDVFEANMLCYVQAAGPLAMGIDQDKDGLNTRVETDLGTMANLPDSDADGITDGIEYRTGTNPTSRDTDVDGLPDGIEDANWNGRIDPGETDPRTADGDRDGLCDGLCLVKLRRGEKLYIGEDRNLNGKVDQKETDPRKLDSDGDGDNDYQEWINCHLAGKKDC